MSKKFVAMETITLAKGTPKKINAEQHTLACRRLYHEALALGWKKDEVEVTISASRDLVTVNLKFVANAGFDQTWYTAKYDAYLEQLAPFFGINGKW